MSHNENNLDFNSYLLLLFIFNAMLVLFSHITENFKFIIIN